MLMIVNYCNLIHGLPLSPVADYQYTDTHPSVTFIDHSSGKKKNIIIEVILHSSEHYHITSAS